MRQFTVSGRDVEECAEALLEESLELPDQGRKCRASVVLHVLLYAAARITSLFDACTRLPKAPSDDAVRRALIVGLPEICELERRLNEALLASLPRSLRNKKGRWRLAVDLTLIPYHGEPFIDWREVYRGEAKSGTTHFHAYGSCYVVHKGRRFTLALARVELGTPMEEVVRRLLARVREAGISPRFLLLDRGFASASVIRYLQAARIPFLMPAPLRGRAVDDPRGPSATRVFSAQKKSGWSEYSWRSAKGQHARVQVAIVRTRRRRRRGRRQSTTLVYFYWGFQPPNTRWVRETYRQRFGIETSYRQMNQARIRTSTRNPILRLLFVGVALLLRNVWVWLHLLLLAEPNRGARILRLEALRFRTMLLWLVRLFQSEYEVCDHAIAYTPPPAELKFQARIVA
jgi:putative transposase